MDIPQIADRNRATPAGWSRSGGAAGPQSHRPPHVRQCGGRRSSNP